MQRTLLVIASVLAGCRPPAPSAPATTGSRDLSAAWIAAVGAKDATAIEGMLALPFTLYYDDGYSDPFHAAGCGPVRVIRQITTDAERTRVASCIAATVRLTTVSPTSDPIGIATPEAVMRVIPPELHAEITARAADHVFTRVGSIASGDYDVTLAVPQQGSARANLVVLWTIHG